MEAPPPAEAQPILETEVVKKQDINEPTVSYYKVQEPDPPTHPSFSTFAVVAMVHENFEDDNAKDEGEDPIESSEEEQSEEEVIPEEIDAESSASVALDDRICQLSIESACSDIDVSDLVSNLEEKDVERHEGGITPVVEPQVDMPNRQFNAYQKEERALNPRAARRATGREARSWSPVPEGAAPRSRSSSPEPNPRKSDDGANRLHTVRGRHPEPVPKKTSAAKDLKTRLSTPSSTQSDCSRERSPPLATPPMRADSPISPGQDMSSRNFDEKQPRGTSHDVRLTSKGQGISECDGLHKITPVQHPSTDRAAASIAAKNLSNFSKIPQNPDGSRDLKSIAALTGTQHEHDDDHVKSIAFMAQPRKGHPLEKQHQKTAAPRTMAEAAASCAEPSTHGLPPRNPKAVKGHARIGPRGHRGIAPHSRVDGHALISNYVRGSPITGRSAHGGVSGRSAAGTGRSADMFQNNIISFRNLNRCKIQKVTKSYQNFGFKMITQMLFLIAV